MRRFLLLAAATGICAFAADRPVLNGTWQLDPSQSQFGDNKLKGETWLITQKDGSVVIAETVTDSGGKERKVNIECGTEGQNCQVKENGQATQVSMYYNGDALVMLEQWHGNDNVTKKRIRTDGKTLTVEVMHIAPPGHKDEVLKFVKQ
jgi:hypothetical protein